MNEDPKTLAEQQMKKSPTGHLAALIGAAASLVAVLTWLGVSPPRAHNHATKKAPANTAHKSTKAAAAPRAPQPAKVREQVLDGSVSPVAGAWHYDGGKVSVGGRVFTGYGTLSAATPFATFDVGGWDTFTVSFGMSDNHPTPAPEFDVSLEVDGRPLRKYRVEAGTMSETVEISLRGGRAVTLRCVRAVNADDSPCTGELANLVFAEPKLAGK
jgi:hypothetical protein